jgi:hypothetical protein
MKKHCFVCVLLFIVLLSANAYSQVVPWDNGKVVVSANHHFLQFENGKPFFWLFDTGWLLFLKLNREEALRYLDDRKAKGFTGIQCMVLHSVPEVNWYGDSAFVNNDPSKIKTTPGSDTNIAGQYDYWDHIEFIVDEAAQRGLYVALVPVWGNIVKQGFFTRETAGRYAQFLAERFTKHPNIFWIVGGDIQGDVKNEIWETIGATIKKYDPNHLITFHPYGRTQSSTWFHNSAWLDFNMFQSGHRRYDQDNTRKKYGEDNWRYVREDFNRMPTKPVLDGEPSYENIPQGLHDTTQPYWTAHDVRRYAYWSVFAGACGHTYGDNAVMQFYKPGDKQRAYGAKNFWFEALNDSGSFHMRYVKSLILSRPYVERINDQSAIAGNQGTKYNYVIVSRGADFLMAYSYTGQPFTLKMGIISGPTVKAWWYNPRNGEAAEIGIYKNTGVKEFIPPQELRDWVLVLDDEAKHYAKPSEPIE